MLHTPSPVSRDSMLLTIENLGQKPKFFLTCSSAVQKSRRSRRRITLWARTRGEYAHPRLYLSLALGAYGNFNVRFFFTSCRFFLYLQDSKWIK
jgi:hypothetical protein